MPNTPPEGSADWIEELDRRCAFWQKVLRLQDWLVTAGFVRHVNCDEEDAAGYIAIEATHKRAQISLVDPDDWPDEWVNEKDYEVALVHELIHLFFNPLNVKKGTPQHDAMEVAINCLAEALVTLLRRGEEEPHLPKPLPEAPDNPWRYAFLKNERSGWARRDEQ